LSSLLTPDFIFSAMAISLELYRQRKLEIGVRVFDVPALPGMPFHMSTRWILVFSTPSFVFAAFAVYRLLIRLNQTTIVLAVVYERWSNDRRWCRTAEAASVRCSRGSSSVAFRLGAHQR